MEPLTAAVLAAFLAAFSAGCGGAAVAPAVPKVLDLNHRPGEYIDVEASLVAGVVTIVDFRADWCGACDKIEAMVLADLAHEPVVIRRVDVGAGQTAVARAYDIGALPHIRIFDRRKRLRYVLVGNEALRSAELARSLIAER